MLQPLDLLFVFFATCAGLHLGPVLVKALILILHKVKSATQGPQPVSIIVCARNEEKNLRELVPRLLDQDHPEFEVIIVLDRCFDQSLDFLKSLEPQHPNLRTLIVDYVPDQFHPKKFGLTLAIKGAKYEWVLLTDADCRPGSNQWASHMANQFESGADFVLGYSPYERKATFLNHFIQYETFITGFEYLAFALLRMPYMGVGRNLAYRKSLFLKAKGFNAFQGVTGGDDDLFVQHHARPTRSRIALQEEATTLSKPKTSWRAYWKQKRRHLSVGKFYRKSVILRHIWKSNIHLGLWLSFITLAILNFSPEIVWPVMLSIFAMKGLLFWWSAQKMGQGYQYWITPILDFTYAFFIPVTGIIAFFRKNIPWR